MTIDRVEKRLIFSKPHVIYWLKSEYHPNMGVIFQGTQTCGTDEIISGIILSDDIVKNCLDELE